jgi:hypothetical protein
MRSRHLLSTIALGLSALSAPLTAQHPFRGVLR